MYLSGTGRDDPAGTMEGLSFCQTERTLRGGAFKPWGSPGKTGERMLPAYRSSSCALVGELTRVARPRYPRGHDPRAAALAFVVVNVVAAGAIALYLLVG